ncbi:cytochrome P450 2F3-like [Ptychodera flava]|uniref:cytochrome P450 2F3-like n=1 Tax=Ptychodera flava TaxID=63121 RepID=UPI003969E3F2
MVVIEINAVTGLLLTFALAVVAWFYLRPKLHGKKKYNLPPGPKGWPIVGMLFKIGTQPQRQFLEMSEKFGKIFSMKVGSQTVVVLNGYQAVKEALVDKAQFFSGRPELWIFRRMKDGGGLGTRTYDRVWKKHRTFMLTHFRNFGVGKRSLEEKILEEAEVLCQAMEATKGKPVNCHHELQCAVTNVMCNILFGSRWEYADNAFHKLLDLTAEFVSKLNHTTCRRTISHSCGTSRTEASST